MRFTFKRYTRLYHLRTLPDSHFLVLELKGNVWVLIEAWWRVHAIQNAVAWLLLDWNDLLLQYGRHF